MDLLVFKVGSAVLVNKDYSLNQENLHKIVKNLSEVRKNGFEVLLVSSGAVACGRSIMTLDNNSKDAYAAIGQAKLMNIYADLFRAKDITVAQLLLHRDNFANRNELVPLRNTITTLLSNGVLPIVNENDPVVNRQFNDNDELAMLLAITLGARGLYLISNVDGLYEEDPSKNKNAKLVQVVEKVTPEIFQMIGKSVSSVGKGGMYSKLRSAQKAQEAGVDTWMINGTKDSNAILDCAVNGKCGTYFKARDSSDSALKKWLKSGASPIGVIVVDSGAAKALNTRRSLLAVGVKEIQGEFSEKDVIDIVNEDGNQICVAMSGISSKNLRQCLDSGKTNDTIVAHADYISLF
jgi:glutamate 5-kinase